MAARSVPTFLVGAEEQGELLEQFQRRCLHFTEAYQKNKPLCFSAFTHQQQHPDKARSGRKDADATMASPMLLGVCDGVSQVAELGLDASKLPRELLKSCEEIAASQLFAGSTKALADVYAGPISLLKEAYSETESLGSTSVLLAVMDNSTQIHGKLHPMIGVVTLGDCELVMLRRTGGRQGRLQVILHTEMQRIGGHNQTPLQLARMSESMDPAFDEDQALDAIERGSGLHCTSTYEGDLLILGSDGVFDNLFLSEVVEICNERLPPSQRRSFVPAQPSLLSEIALSIVQRAHAKSEFRIDRPVQPTPLGVGGKADDTSVVVAEVVEWTAQRRAAWERSRGCRPAWRSVLSCGVGGSPCSPADDAGANSSDSEGSEDEAAEDVKGCCIL